MTGTQEQHAQTLPHDPYGHGHSVAAWTAAALVIVGSLIMSLAIVFPALWAFIVGAVVAGLSIPASMMLTAMGLGSRHRNTR
jgi:hypothetical protein